MDESKKVTIVRAGGVASVEIEVFPTDTVEQVCTLAAPQLGLPAEGTYQLLGADGNPIKSDLYKSIKAGDKLTLAQMGQGGNL